MICKTKRIVLVLCLVATIVSVVFSPVSAFCETLDNIIANLSSTNNSTQLAWLDTQAAQTNPPTPPWQNSVDQLLNGTCGADVDTSTPTVANPQAANTYYFSVVDINDSKVTITSYSGDTGDYIYFLKDTDTNS